METEQEIAVAHAIAFLQESGAVFICVYGFPNETEAYVEGMGDRCPENQQQFLTALLNHWAPQTDEPFTPY
jgi:hypothetical protein